MKRYIVERRNDIIDFKEREQGGLIFYRDFRNLILSRIKELETEIENEDSEASCKFRIDELKNLIKC